MMLVWNTWWVYFITELTSCGYNELLIIALINLYVVFVQMKLSLQTIVALILLHTIQREKIQHRQFKHNWSCQLCLDETRNNLLVAKKHSFGPNIEHCGHVWLSLQSHFYWNADLSHVSWTIQYRRINSQNWKIRFSLYLLYSPQWPHYWKRSV